MQVAVVAWASIHSARGSSAHSRPEQGGEGLSTAPGRAAVRLSCAVVGVVQGAGFRGRGATLAADDSFTRLTWRVVVDRRRASAA